MRPAGPAAVPHAAPGEPAAAASRADGAVERLIRRDRAVVAAGLIALVALAWAYLVRTAGTMSSADAASGAMGGMEMGAGMAMPDLAPWSVGDLALLFAMWAVMMVAMMLPSAAPMVLLFASVNRRRRERASPYVPTAVFVLGYLLVWLAFSAAAALAQWGLHRAALLSPAMVSGTPVLAGLLLLAAGTYQLTPLKRVCLTRCRSPLGFLSTEWREGAGGALRMGARHGTFCVGCCWILMALLFVAGVMNLAWIAVLAGFVLLEKVLARGAWVSRAAGLLLIGWGAWTLALGLA